MKKRFKLQCWNCEKTYSLYRQVSEDLKLFVACPYCEKEALADLKPYKKEKKKIMRSIESDEKALGLELQLPEILPTMETNQESNPE